MEISKTLENVDTLTPEEAISLIQNSTIYNDLDISLQTKIFFRAYDLGDSAYYSYTGIASLPKSSSNSDDYNKEPIIIEGVKIIDDPSDGHPLLNVISNNDKVGVHGCFHPGFLLPNKEVLRDKKINKLLDI